MAGGGVERDNDRLWRWVGEQAEIHLFNPTDQIYPVSLDLHMESYMHTRPLALRLNQDDLGSIMVSRAAMRRTVTFLLAPGQHVLYLNVPADVPPGDQGRKLGIAFLSIRLDTSAGEARADVTIANGR